MSARIPNFMPVFFPKLQYPCNRQIITIAGNYQNYLGHAKAGNLVILMIISNDLHSVKLISAVTC